MSTSENYADEEKWEEADQKADQKTDQVGESAGSTTARNAQHFSTAQSTPGMFKSAIMQHAADASHHFRTSDIKVLSREAGWHERGIRESIYICGLSLSLNRN